MGLVNMTAMLKTARDGKYAVGAFNIVDYTSTWAAVKAAQLTTAFGRLASTHSDTAYRSVMSRVSRSLPRAGIPRLSISAIMALPSWP